MLDIVSFKVMNYNVSRSWWYWPNSKRV